MRNNSLLLVRGLCRVIFGDGSSDVDIDYVTAAEAAMCDRTVEDDHKE